MSINDARRAAGIGMTDLEWVDKLEHIASRIRRTVYDHDLEMGKHERTSKVGNDDADLLHVLAKDLRVREFRRLLAEAEAAK